MTLVALGLLHTAQAGLDQGLGVFWGRFIPGEIFISKDPLNEPLEGTGLILGLEAT